VPRASPRPIRVPYLQDEDCLLIVPSLYDGPDFAALYHVDKARAIALVAAMTEPQRVRQALAYAAWLAYHGLEIDLMTMLAAWEQL
jgi:hypothetical protein